MDPVTPVVPDGGTPTPPDGGTPTPDPNAPPASPTDETKVVVKVDGQDREMTLGELKASASKSEGADARFRQAADAVKTQQLVTKLMSSETGLQREEATQLSRLVGGKAEDFMFEAPATPPAPGTPPAAPGTPPATPATKVSYDDLDEDVREEFDEAKKQRYLRKVEETKTEVKNSLDNHADFIKIIDRVPEDRRSALGDELFEMVFEEVSRQVLSRQAYGPDLVADCIKKMTGRIERVGIPTKSTNAEIVELPITTDGVGPSKLSISELSSDKPIERVPITDKSYADNFVKRLGQRLLKSGAK
jgi:hypothetical protein